MRIACLHTAANHQNTFNDLFAREAPEAAVVHVVREDLLAEAQVGGLHAVTEATMTALGALGQADAVLCTCSTLGPLVDAIQNRKYIRIDRPTMEAAVMHGPNPLLAICLESTRDACLELLMDAGEGRVQPTVHMVADAWPYFTEGNMDAFADVIAGSVARAVDGHDCVILGQASMAVTAI
ncbi:MAG: hypothetical protein AAFQ09_10690, partial [Pseudomonadota bacterium]